MSWGFLVVVVGMLQLEQDLAGEGCEGPDTAIGGFWGDGPWVCGGFCDGGKGSDCPFLSGAAGSANSKLKCYLEMFSRYLINFTTTN